MAENDRGTRGNGEAWRWEETRTLRQLLRIGAFAALTGLVLAGALSFVKPQYGAQAQLLIERAGGAAAGAPDALVLASQIEVLRAPELLARLAERHELNRDPEFNDALGRLSPLQRFAVLADLIPDPAVLPEKERVIRNLSARLNVFLVPDSRRVAISLRTGDADKSARLVNDLASVYIGWLAAAVPSGQPDDRALSQSAAENETIDALRARIASGEARLAALFAAKRDARSIEPTPRADERLADLNRQYILARAKREEIEAQARQIRDLLARGQDLQRTHDLFNTGAIQHLIDSQDELQQMINDQSAALLPAHPRMKRLNSELDALRAQVHAEAKVVVTGLDDEAHEALVRENSLKASLEQAQVLPGAPLFEEASIDELRLSLNELRHRLAESEARRDAAGILRSLNGGHLTASIITRAIADHDPASPNKVPVILGGMMVPLLFGLLRLWAKTVFGWPRVDRRQGDRRRTARQEWRLGEEAGLDTAAPAGTDMIAPASG